MMPEDMSAFTFLSNQIYPPSDIDLNWWRAIRFWMGSLGLSQWFNSSRMYFCSSYIGISLLHIVESVYLLGRIQYCPTFAWSQSSFSVNVFLYIVFYSCLKFLKKKFTQKSKFYHLLTFLLFHICIHFFFLTRSL